MSLLNKFEEIFNLNIEGYNKEEIIEAYNRGEFICHTGSISGLIYTHETLEIFENHSIELLEFLINNDYVISIDDREDLENQINNIVWFAFEIYVDYKINKLELMNE